MPQHTGSRPLPTAAIIVAVGGLIALIGTFLDWATVDIKFSGPFLDQVPEQSGGESGISHWTGILALIGGLVAVVGAGALAFAPDARLRRYGAWAGLIGGAVAVGIAVLGIFVKDEILNIDQARGFLQGLGGLGGLTSGVEFNTGIGLGLFITIVGGLSAVVGGWLAGREAPVPAAPATDDVGLGTPPPPPGPQPSEPTPPPAPPMGPEPPPPPRG